MKQSHQLNFNAPAPDLTLVSTTRTGTDIQSVGPASAAAGIHPTFWLHSVQADAG